MKLSHLTRRQTLTALLAGSGTSILGCAEPFIEEPTDATFLHGVASGDPRIDAVILWTRVTTNARTEVPVHWAIAQDPEFSKVVRFGKTQTSASADFTVKIDVQELKRGEIYYYRFKVGDKYSPVGRTKTLPSSDVEKISLAIVSCSHYAFGYFNVYRELTRHNDLDAVIHLGDYIYEAGAEGYGGEIGKTLGRQHQPANELLTLQDYRQRFAQYRTDPDLQAAHASTPFITIWDDHETADNAWASGAVYHDPKTKGDWTERRNAALQAYYEWMPIRDPEPGQLFYQLHRTYDFGTIASLHIIESRLTARSQQVSYSKDMVYKTTPFDFSDPKNPKPIRNEAYLATLPAALVRYVKTPFDMRGDIPIPILDYGQIEAFSLNGLPEGFDYSPDLETFRRDVLGDENRQMLGARQEAWLAKELRDSRAKNISWQILGNQTLMVRMDAPYLVDAFPEELIADAKNNNPYVRDWLDVTRYGLPINSDSWDGYPAARKRVFDIARSTNANLLVVAGDTHNFWANELHDETDGKRIGVEFGTSSVTSMGGYEWLGDAPEIFSIAEQKMMEKNKAVRFFNARDRGYIHLELTSDKAHANFIKVDTVRSRKYTADRLKRFTVTIDSPGNISAPEEDR